MRAHYPLSTLYGDYIRALIGCVFAGLPLIFAGGSLFILIAFGALFVLFAGFGLRTALHQLTTVELTAGAIESHGPVRKRLPWSAIDKIELKFFSTRRDKNSGWMQLKIFGAGASMTIESNIERFEEITARTLAVAKQNRAKMDEATIENLTNMGLEPPSTSGGAA